MMWLYPALFLVTIFVLLYQYCTRNFDYWKKRNIFYVKPKPFLGNLLNLITAEPLGFSFMQLCKTVGNRDYFGMFIFDRPVLIVTNPKLVKSILQKDSATFIDRSLGNASKHPVMSNLLSFQRNPVWKEARAKLSPMFSSSKLKMMFPLMQKECTKMTDYISTIANVPNVESKEICAKYSTNVITRCAFAVEANSFKNENAVFRDIGKKMFDFRFVTAIRQMGYFFAPKTFTWLNVTFFDPSIVTSLEGIFSDVFKSRKATLNRKGNDLVDILLDAHGTSGEKSFTEEAMLGQAIQMFAAGFETVSASLSYTLYELAINSDIQDKLRKEVVDYLGKNSDITYELLHEMKYLDMVLTETLRKYPPVPFLDRMCNNDYKVEGSDLVIEKGISVYIPTYSLHYNPKYFPNPDKYDPERYLDKSVVNSDGLWYIPFGDGPRICLGQRFGLMETKIGVISILLKYKIEKSSKTPVPLQYEVKSLVLQSKVGIPLKFVPIL